MSKLNSFDLNSNTKKKFNHVSDIANFLSECKCVVSRPQPLYNKIHYNTVLDTARPQLGICNYIPLQFIHFTLNIPYNGKFLRHPIFAVSINPRKLKSAKYFPIFEKLVLRN